MPAFNESERISGTLEKIFAQAQRSGWQIEVIVVNDGSTDDTARIVREYEARHPGLRLIENPGNRGKGYSVRNGMLQAHGDILLFTDADIVYAPDALSRLVARAQQGRFVLTSLMVKLRSQSLAERAFIPAFIFFFQMLYPFAWANNPRRAAAAAAGGCMLVRREALRAAGGMIAIRNALIDDCALAKNLKLRGPIWIGLTESVHSIRAYPSITDIRRMVSRSAYAQLRYSPLALAATICGLAMTYLAPVALALFADGAAKFIGILVWLLMAIALRPTLWFYRVSMFWGLALPAIAAVYMAFTVDSAYQHARGRGGMWKGRAQANVSELR